MEKQTWLIIRDSEINNEVHKPKKKGIQWYTETRTNSINDPARPSGSKSKKDDEVYIYQKNYAIWAKGKVLEGGDKKENFHEFTTLRDVANFSQTKAKHKNNTFWGKRILDRLGKKKDGEFKFIVFEAKLELEPIDPIFISEKKMLPPWSQLKENIEDLKVKKEELSTTIPPSLMTDIHYKAAAARKGSVVGLDIDHIVPKIIGGPGNIEENLIAIPASVNRHKGAKIPEGLFKIAKTKEYKQLFSEEFKFFKDKERERIKHGNEVLLRGQEVRVEAAKIVDIINTRLDFEKAKEFYKRVKKVTYPND